MIRTKIHRIQGQIVASAIVMLSISFESGAQTVAVRADTLENLSIPYRRSAPAEVSSLNRPSLSAEISARVISIPVRSGDVVSAGALLVELDCRDYIIQADVARERARLAGIQLERIRKLFANQNVSETQVDQQETDTIIARKDVESAGLRIERCGIKSPFSAAVGERLASVGEFLRPGTPVLMLTDLDSVVVSARISANDAGSIDASVNFEFSTVNGNHDVILEALSPVIDLIDRSREARLHFKAENQVPIGTIGRLIWQSGKSALPSSYLVQRGLDLGVFVLEAGKARYIPLPGAQEGRPVEVNLPKNTLIITEGRERARDGDKVEALK